MNIIETGIISGIPFRICQIRHYYTAYVAVPPKHPWHGKFYDDLPPGSVEFTYSQFEGTVYVIGWDYAHYGQEDTTFEKIKADVNYVIFVMTEAAKCLGE